MDDLLGDGSSQRWDDSGEKPVQRGAHFALVDEADSILIDEARTPLIIGALGDKAREQVVATYKWAAEHAPKFVEDEDYEYDHDKRKVELTAEGRQKVRALPAPDLLRGVGMVDLYEYIERAIKVDREFHLDRQYVVRDGEIVIVDEFTGRLAEGRKWRDGIHQAVEAKEGVEVTVPTGQAARITVQDFFLRYRHLAGMTGTALTSARELRKIYRRRVVRVPTNRPVNRERLPTRVFGTSEQKWEAVVEEVRQLHATGRPVLIGTRSIDKSELLSRLLDGGRDRAPGAQRQRDRRGGRDRGPGRAAGEGDRLDEHGRPRHRHQAGPNVAELGRPARDLHRDARRGPHRPPADRPLRPPGRPGHVPPVPRAGRRDPPQRPGPRQCGQDRGDWAAGQRPARSLREAVPRCPAQGRTQHFRDRKMLLYHEKERKKMQREMGQDPYLDTAE